MSATSKQVSTGAGVVGGGGGLFDDEEDEDFFRGKSLKTSDSGKCVRMGTSVPQSKFRWNPHPQTVCWVLFFLFQL